MLRGMMDNGGGTGRTAQGQDPFQADGKGTGTARTAYSSGYDATTDYAAGDGYGRLPEPQTEDEEEESGGVNWFAWYSIGSVLAAVSLCAFAMREDLHAAGMALAGTAIGLSFVLVLMGRKVWEAHMDRDDAIRELGLCSNKNYIDDARNELIYYRGRTQALEKEAYDLRQKLTESLTRDAEHGSFLDQYRSMFVDLKQKKAEDLPTADPHTGKWTSDTAENMKSKQVRAFEMRMLGKSDEEIAEECGIGIKSVSVYVSRGKKEAESISCYLGGESEEETQNGYGRWALITPSDPRYPAALRARMHGLTGDPDWETLFGGDNDSAAAPDTHHE